MIGKLPLAGSTAQEMGCMSTHSYEQGIFAELVRDLD